MKPVVFLTGVVVGWTLFYVWDEWCQFQGYVKQMTRR